MLNQFSHDILRLLLGSFVRPCRRRVEGSDTYHYDGDHRGKEKSSFGEACHPKRKCYCGGLKTRTHRHLRTHLLQFLLRHVNLRHSCHPWRMSRKKTTEMTMSVLRLFLFMQLPTAKRCLWRLLLRESRGPPGGARLTQDTQDILGANSLFLGKDSLNIR